MAGNEVAPHWSLSVRVACRSLISQEWRPEPGNTNPEPLVKEGQNRTEDGGTHACNATKKKKKKHVAHWKGARIATAGGPKVRYGEQLEQLERLSEDQKPAARSKGGAVEKSS